MSERAGGMPLKAKALLLLVGVAGLPMAVAGPVLVELNRDALTDSEKRAQSATLGEAEAITTGLVAAVRGDAMAVAAAMAEAAANPRPQGDGLAGVRATLATRRSFESVRFEVPAARVDTVLRKEGTAGAEPPASTEALRAQADERGVAFVVHSVDQAQIIVPIEMGAGKGARGYISAGVSVDAMRSELSRIVLARFSEGHATLLLVDGQRRVVASAGSSPLSLRRSA